MKEKRNNLSDQFRKQQHKREIKRNKQQRKQNKEIKVIRNDIAKVREELEKLEKLEREGCLDNALRPKKMRLATYYGKLLTAQEKEAVKAATAVRDDDSSSDDDSDNTNINEIPPPPPFSSSSSSLADVPPPPPPAQSHPQFQYPQFQSQSVVMPYGTFNESAVPSYTAYLKSQMSRISYQKQVQEKEEAYQKECEERKRKEEQERAAREAEEAAAVAATSLMLEDIKFMPMALRIKRQQSLAEKRKAYALESGGDALGVPAKKQKVVVQSSVLTPTSERVGTEQVALNEVKLGAEKTNCDTDKEVNKDKSESRNEESANNDDDEFADFMNDMKELGAF